MGLLLTCRMIFCMELLLLFLFITGSRSFAPQTIPRHASSISRFHHAHTAGSSSSKSSAAWTDMMDRFHGDFDNYHQVVQDRKEGKLPKEGGGHEHIHCTLVPLSPSKRLAAFYFDGNPRAIFRFRYYELIASKDGKSIDTVLYTLNSSLEGQLRAASMDPLAWPDIFQAFAKDNDNAESSSGAVTLLPNCNVRWTAEMDPVQHRYVRDYHKNDDYLDIGLHAVMVHGSAIVNSQMMPGQEILVKDQLSLWPDEFWIHDRGFDPVSGAYIYGNQDEVPYRLERVTRIEDDDDGGGQRRRMVTNASLAWTLGPDYRTEDQYVKKLAAMGGPSVSR